MIFSEWNCAVPEDVENVKLKWPRTCNLSGEELLKQFFVFYSKIPLEQFILCTFTGMLEVRKHFFRKSRFRKFFKRYRNKYGRNAMIAMQDTNKNETTGFFLSDPLNQILNITNKMTRTEAQKCSEFVYWSRQTVKLLQ